MIKGLCRRTFEAAAQLVLQHSGNGDDTEAAATEPQQVMAVRPFTP